MTCEGAKYYRVPKFELRRRKNTLKNNKMYDLTKITNNSWILSSILKRGCRLFLC
jgi:hypothetical protein